MRTAVDEGEDRQTSRAQTPTGRRGQGCFGVVEDATDLDVDRSADSASPSAPHLAVTSRSMYLLQLFRALFVRQDDVVFVDGQTKYRIGHIGRIGTPSRRGTTPGRACMPDQMFWRLFVQLYWRA